MQTLGAPGAAQRCLLKVRGLSAASHPWLLALGCELVLRLPWLLGHFLGSKKGKTPF